jgi:cation:H+ antiporter
VLFVTLAAGLVLLFAGGELLVRGAVRLARALGVPPLVIGITVVGFGTSTPELVASLEAALAGLPGLAVGNIVGSNIANILLILGLAALVTPIACTPQTMRRDGALGVAAALLLVLAGLFGEIARPAGMAFLLGLAAYVWYLLRHGRVPAEALPDGAEALPETGTVMGAGLSALAGIAMVIAGGWLLVEGAVGLARLLGVSDGVVGLTVVAVGTSLPELATTLMAALRRAPDIALGNVLGSNVYNVLGIAGMTATVVPLPIPAAMATFDLPLMAALSILLAALGLWLRVLGRLTGVLFLAGYGTYVALLYG